MLPEGSRVIRAAVAQDDVDLVRTRTKGVSVRLAERVEVSMAATLVREIPAGRDELLSKAADDVAQVRIAARRGALADLAEVAQPLTRDARQLQQFVEQNS